MAKKTLFDTLYAAAEGVVQTMQKPAREKMIRRVAERLSDEVEDQRIELEAKLMELRHRLANVKDEDEARAIYKEIVFARAELVEAQSLAADVLAERAALFAPTE